MNKQIIFKNNDLISYEKIIVRKKNVFKLVKTSSPNGHNLTLN